MRTFWRRLVDVFKTSSRRLQDIYATSSKRHQEFLQRCLQDVFKTYYQVKLFLLTRFRNVLKTCWRCLEDVFARHIEDVLPSRLQGVLKTSCKRLKRLEDVLKMYDKTNILVLIYTSSEDVWVRRIYSSW